MKGVKHRSRYQRRLISNPEMLDAIEGIREDDSLQRNISKSFTKDT